MPGYCITARYSRAPFRPRTIVLKSTRRRQHRASVGAKAGQCAFLRIFPVSRNSLMTLSSNWSVALRGKLQGRMIPRCDSARIKDMKAAIYARYSTDLQSEKSIEDQVALCQSYAGRNGFVVVGIFQDRARSGASVLGRDGLMQVMDAARDRRFDAIIVESLDRLSRDQEDLAGIWKRLSFLGVEIRAVHEGRADAIQIGVRGLVGALYLQDLAHKVRRGLSGVVRTGRYPGGRPYGYRPVPGKPGELEFVPAEAEVVRRIFTEYAEGDTPRTIAARLNREAVLPPRGKWWGPSVLLGSRKRGSGILANELYVGRIVWNKVRMVKDPDTGKRVSRPNPVAEHESVDVPALAIIERELFERVRSRRLDEAHDLEEPMKRSARTLLSGILKCGACGSGMVSHDRDKTGKARVRCSLAKQSGSCDHTRLYYREAIEAVVLEGLKRELASPKLIREYVLAYDAERKRLARAESAARGKREQRLGEVKRSLRRIIDAIADGSVPAFSVRERILELEGEKAALEARAPTADTPVALHPAALERYLGQIETLSAELKAQGTIAPGSPAAIFRELVEAVVVHPVPPRTRLDVELRGHLSALIGNGNLAPHGRYSGFEGAKSGSGGGI